jgi:hypothetical protein
MRAWPESSQRTRSPSPTALCSWSSNSAARGPRRRTLQIDRAHRHAKSVPPTALGHAVSDIPDWAQLVWHADAHGKHRSKALRLGRKHAASARTPLRAKRKPGRCASPSSSRRRCQCRTMTRTSARGAPAACPLQAPRGRRPRRPHPARNQRPLVGAASVSPAVQRGHASSMKVSFVIMGISAIRRTVHRHPDVSACAAIHRRQTPRGRPCAGPPVQGGPAPAPRPCQRSR